MDEDDGFLPMSEYENDTDETSYHTVDDNSKSNINGAQPRITTPSTTSTEDCNNQTTMSIDSTVVPSTAASTEDDSRYTTQDTMPSDANPFPFADLVDDEDSDEVMDTMSHAVSAVSPLPSAVPSPAVSRVASPQPESATQHLEDSTMMEVSVIVEPAVVEPAAVTSPTNASSSPGTQTPTNVVCRPVAPTSSETPASTKASKARKRKSPSEAPVAVVEPPSKRPRTKTMRAIASEEQNNARKKSDGGKKRASGKENSSAGSGGKSSVRGKQV